LEQLLRDRLSYQDPLPFEFRVIETILINVLNSLQSEMESILPHIERLLLSLEDENIDNTKIKLMLQYNKRLNRFHKKVTAIEDAISDVLEYGKFGPWDSQ
jgi:magnesium transporter